MAAKPAQSVWPITTARTTPSFSTAAPSERRTSSEATAPALRITFASPSVSPSTASGSIRASMQVRIASRRRGWARCGGRGAAGASAAGASNGASSAPASRARPNGSQLNDDTETLYSASCW